VVGFRTEQHHGDPLAVAGRGSRVSGPNGVVDTRCAVSLDVSQGGRGAVLDDNPAGASQVAGGCADLRI